MEEGKAKPEAGGLVIFDCDGVLVDSEPISNRVMAAAITEAGLPMDAAEAAGAFAGMRLDDIQGEVERRLGRKLPAGWIAAFEQRRESAFRTGGLEAVPGVADVLIRLREAGLSICVASQASREKVELVLSLTDLRRHFQAEALFSSRMVERGKPYPDLFLFAAGSMEFDPADCVVVEDGALGVRAARLAGIKVLGYAPEDEAAERLTREGATIFRSMAELARLV